MAYKPTPPVFNPSPKPAPDYFINGLVGSSIGSGTSTHQSGATAKKIIDGIFNPLGKK